MAASELRVQPQLEQAWAVRGTATTSGINKQQEMSGVAVPRRAMTEVFMASPENATDRTLGPKRPTSAETAEWHLAMQGVLDRIRRGAAGRAGTAGVLDRSGSGFAQPGRMVRSVLRSVLTPVPAAQAMARD